MNPVMNPVVKAKVVKMNVETGEYELMDQEVEVLTLHLNKNTMRVRWVEQDPRTYPMHQGTIRTSDISSNAFFNQYELNQRK